MRKRYEVRGMMEWHPMFAVGRARIQVSFTGGHLADGCSTPAACETSDAVLQQVIEHSEFFRSGRIRLAKTFGPQLPETPHKPSTTPAAASGRCTAGSYSAAKPASTRVKTPELPFEDISGGENMVEAADYAEASDILHEKYDIPMAQLMTDADCLRAAERLGVTLKIKQP